jgi:urea transport system permease protein
VGRAGVGFMRTTRRCLGAFVSIAALTVGRSPAHAGPLEVAGAPPQAVVQQAVVQQADIQQAIAGLGAPADEKIEAAVQRLAALGDPRAIPALDALCDDRLRVAADGQVYVWDAKARDLRRPLGGAVVTPAPKALKEVEIGNDIRRIATTVLAELELASPDASVRLGAAEELSRSGSAEAAVMLHRAAEREHDSGVRDALGMAVARVDLASANPAARIAALQLIARSGNDGFLAEIRRLQENGPDGRPREPDPRVRAEAGKAVEAIASHERLVGFVGSLVHGLSLASVLLFAALGLAITFGLLGVINMAHGEMLMLGAYATYTVQTAFQAYIPGAQRYYLLAAIPVAFFATALVGILLERTVIRHLYGRPLETLLATWGISLGLIQTVRLVFGAQNVSVANPDWLAGGLEIAHGLVLPWSRIAVVGFVVVVAAAVWFIIQRTRFGLQVRAVTQNRAMAACMGIPTRRVDAWVFGLGSGIAGLGGVALSQLGNVGPELGQSYIIDSFMVVVLGGVGRLAGAVAAALGLGVLNKLIEPAAGAVLGKIAVLVVVILFIQRRPQGLVALQGRVEV